MRIGLACEVSTPPAEVLDLLGAAGLPVSMLRGETAPALFHPNGVTWFLGSAADVLSGCDRGALDAGVVGSDDPIAALPEAICDQPGGTSVDPPFA